MLDFTKLFFFRASLLAAAVLCCYQPELALAATHHHHHPKVVKHVAKHHKITHPVRTAKHKSIPHHAPVAVADNIQFTIGPNNTIVANNVVIPSVPAPAQEENGIEILTDAQAQQVASDVKTEVSSALQPAVVTEQIIPAPVKPAQVIPAVVPASTEATPIITAHDIVAEPPRGYFKFESNDPAPAPTPVAVKKESPHGFAFFHRETKPSAEVAATSQESHSFFNFHRREATPEPTTTQTTVTQQVTTTSSEPHGFFVSHKIEEPTTITQSTVTQQITATHAPTAQAQPVVVTQSQTNVQAAVAPVAEQGFFLSHQPESTTPVIAKATPINTPSAEELSPAPQHHFFHFSRGSAEPATVAVSVTPSRGLGNIAASVHKHLVEFVKNTVTTLRYSDYKLGGSKFDTSKGIYIVDCSSFVDHILKNVSPHAYTSLVNATGAPTPATQHYYEFFQELAKNSDDYWNKVNNVEQLRAGDILVFRTKHSHGAGAAGHVMVVMEKPTKDSNVYFVRVADSAPARHSEDTRQLHEGGIGIGTLMLKVAKSGRPSAYAWGVGGYWNKNVNFAMARPTEFN